ncbi:MAG: hypothetical protein C0602_12795 [Denitrovibrio sp.]|nr:MAG: hypothetical protein C0602_12795 [Denitrovibrio sp.]
MALNLNFKNFALSTLASEAGESDNQIEITDYALFPDGDFTAVIWDSSKSSPLLDSSSEIVSLNRISAGLFQAVRGEESTAPKLWQAGSNIANVVTAETMKYLFAGASISASVSDITDNIYDMGRYDTNTFLIFTTAETYKTVTLPESLLADGITYKITSKGTKSSQTARIYPNIGDSFAHTTDTYVTLTSGSSITLCLSEGEWNITDYVNAKPNGIKKIDANNSDISFGDGVVFADTSAGAVSISLPSGEGMKGIPLTIIKYDDLDNYVYVSAFVESPGAAMIYGKFESMTFIVDDNDQIHFLNRYTPDNIRTKTVTASSTLRGQERFVIADASAGTITLTLPHVDRAIGESVTVKKIDSSANTVTVRSNGCTMDGASTFDLTSQWEYAAFASDGNDWFRVG